MLTLIALLTAAALLTAFATLAYRNYAASMAATRAKHYGPK